MKTIKIDQWLSQWKDYTDKAQQILLEQDVIVQYEFNGVLVNVSRKTDLNLLWRDYNDAQTMGEKEVCDLCEPEQSPQRIKALKQRRTELDKAQEEREAEWKRKDKQQQDEFTNKVVGIDLSISNLDIWNEYVEKNQDPYGKCAVDYARDWGRLMQYYMSNGESIQQCAERASHEIGWYGITGFMYGAAVQMLSQCWKHGEELRKWHNKEYNHEGDGVVNPAILTINPN